MPIDRHTAHFRSRRRGAVARLGTAGLLWILVAPAAEALSRAMWAEFNNIYIINLKPSAECQQYRIRSIALLRDSSLAPDVLDSRMHALWAEAKAPCLVAPAPVSGSARGRSSSATAGTGSASAGAASGSGSVTASVESRAEPAPPALAGAPPARDAAAARVAAVAPAAPALKIATDAGPVAPAGPEPKVVAEPRPAAAAKPTPVAGLDTKIAASPVASLAAAPPAANTPAGAQAGAGGSSTRASTGTNLTGGRIGIVLPELKPAIERPVVIDLRAEAACAKRNPYAYQTASNDDPCSRLAKSRAEKTAADAAATQSTPGVHSRWAWIGVTVTLLVAGGAGGAWLWRRRARGAVAENARAGRDDAPERREHGAENDEAKRAPRPDDDLAAALS